MRAILKNTLNKPLRNFSTLYLFCIAIHFIFVPAYSQSLGSTDVIIEDVGIGNDKDFLEASKEAKYGVVELWNQGDAVAKTTLFILLVMSLGTWTIFLTKFLDQRKVSIQIKALRSSVNESQDIYGIPFDQRDKLSMIKLFIDPVTDAIDLVNRRGEKAQNKDLIYTSVYEGISDLELELQKGLTFLATVGSTAPFVGLFGTVWAIYHALIAIGLAGEASLDKVAGPVGEALVMTAIGLAVAVPAVLAYNWLLRRNKTIMRTLNAVGNRIMST